MSDTKQTPDKRISDLIRQSKSASISDMDMNTITQLPTLQTRNAGAENKVLAETIRDHERSMMDKFHEDLTADTEHTTDPVTVCDVGERYLLVDGHHRYEAFQKAGRSHIPTRLLKTSEQEAQLLATVLNNHTTTIPQGQKERSEKAWREMLRHHDGARWLDGWSGRKFAEKVDVSEPTMRRMVDARKKHGEAAESMTWSQAAGSTEERQRSTEDKLLGWMSQIDKVDLQTDHELDVFIELVRERYQVYESKEKTAERFAAFYDDPKALSAHLEEQMGEF